MSVEYWYMFPVATVVATIAMASGVGGATFFAPILLLALRLPPEVAIGTGLITETFGFASGLYAYVRKRLIDWQLGRMLLLATVPLALLGTWLATLFEPEMLKVILGMGLFAVAASFLRAPDHHEVTRLNAAIEEDFGAGKGETCLQSRDGETFCYTVCNRSEGMTLAGVGGLFVGLISTGLGELNGYFLLRRCRVPSSVAVATSVFVVAVTVLAAAGGHVYSFVQAGGETLTTVGNLVVFTVPGVIIGGQLGARVAQRIPQSVLERSLGILFILIAALTLGEVALSS